jgi:hypothetical protein
MKEIQEVNVTGTSQQTPQRSDKKTTYNPNEIDFYNHHFRSGKSNKLQIVDSDSERYE